MPHEKPDPAALKELKALLYRQAFRFCCEPFPVTREMREAERAYLDELEAERVKGGKP